METNQKIMNTPVGIKNNRLVLGSDAPVKDGVSLEIYFNEIKRYKTLTLEEEVELFADYHSGDPVLKHAAREKLVKHNLKFVVKVAKNYQRSIEGIQLSDLINMGNTGLIKALDKFDVSRNFKFISFAVWWIRQAITENIRVYNTVIDYPQNYYITNMKVKKFIDSFSQENGREPSSDEINEFIDENDLNTYAGGSVFYENMLNLDADIQSSAGQHASTWYDMVPNPNCDMPDDVFKRTEETMLVNNLLKGLTERENYIITRCFGLNGHPVEQLDNIADDLGITTERVRQIRRGLLAKFKQSAKDLL